MDEKMHFMTEPEELLNWMKEHEEFKVMNKEDAQILLNYMEGHDYRLGTDKDQKGKMFGASAKADVSVSDVNNTDKSSVRHFLSRSIQAAYQTGF